MIVDALVIAAASACLAIMLFSKRLAASVTWRATVTPLASIMGSGFLVCAPLLHITVGNYALLAMAGLLLLAFAVGSVVRFNIKYGEPTFETGPHCDALRRSEHRLHIGHASSTHRVFWTGAANGLEKLSHIALALAYFISVSYYLQLLAAFILQPLGLATPIIAKFMTTAVLVGIGIVGIMYGLGMMERVERVAVSANLSVIAALIAGLVYHNTVLLLQGTWRLGDTPVESDYLHVLRVLMGMLIIVQGFETSRFLGTEHSAEERIRTMRWAQIISSVIYLAFVALVSPLFAEAGGVAQTGVTAIVHLARPVALVLPVLITIAAAGSQFSAAVADNAGCAGLLETITRRRFPISLAYLSVSIVTIGVTWLTNVFQVISWASRAFAFYYALQCAVATLVSMQTRQISWKVLRVIVYVGLGIVCGTVALFGIPAE